MFLVVYAYYDCNSFIWSHFFFASTTFTSIVIVIINFIFTMSTVIDLSGENSSSFNPASLFVGFDGINWKEINVHHPQVHYGAAFFYKAQNKGKVPTSIVTKLRAFLLNFTATQLLQAYAYLGGEVADAPKTKRSAIQSVASLVLAKTQHSQHRVVTTNETNARSPVVSAIKLATTVSSASKSSSVTTDAATESSVVSLSPTKRSKPAKPAKDQHRQSL